MKLRDLVSQPTCNHRGEADLPSGVLAIYSIAERGMVMGRDKSANKANTLMNISDFVSLRVRNLDAEFLSRHASR